MQVPKQIENINKNANQAKIQGTTTKRNNSNVKVINSNITKNKTANSKNAANYNDVICIDSDEDDNYTNSKNSLSDQPTVNNRVRPADRKNKVVLPSSKSKFVPPNPQQKVTIPKKRLVPCPISCIKPNGKQKKVSQKSAKSKQTEKNKPEKRFVPTDLKSIGSKSRQLEVVVPPPKVKKSFIPCTDKCIGKQNTSKKSVAKKSVLSSKSYKGEQLLRPKDRQQKVVQPKSKCVQSTQLLSQTEGIKQKEQQKIVQPPLKTSQPCKFEERVRPKDRQQKVVQAPLTTSQPCKSEQRVRPKDRQQKVVQPNAKSMQLSSQTEEIKQRDQQQKNVLPTLKTSQPCKVENCTIPTDRAKQVIKQPMNNATIIVNPNISVKPIGNKLIKPIHNVTSNSLDNRQLIGLKRPLKIVNPPETFNPNIHGNKVQIPEVSKFFNLPFQNNTCFIQGMSPLYSNPSTPTKFRKIGVNQQNFVQLTPSAGVMANKALQPLKGKPSIRNSSDFLKVKSTTREQRASGVDTIKFGCNPNFRKTSHHSEPQTQFVGLKEPVSNAQGHIRGSHHTTPQRTKFFASESYQSEQKVIRQNLKSSNNGKY